MKRFLISIGIIILVLILLFTITLVTPVGLKIVLHVAEKSLPGKLSYKKVSGTLIGPINVSHIHYQYKNKIITLSKLHIQWKPSYLLWGKINAHIKAHITKPYAINLNLWIHGKYNHYLLKGTAKNNDIAWKFDGKGSSQEIQLSTQEAHTLTGRLNAFIKLSFEPNWKWHINLTANHLNLHRLNPQWPTQLNATLKTQGIYFPNKMPTFTLDASIRTPGTLIQINGKHELQWQLGWKINASRLSTLLPYLHGTLHGNGQINGPTKTPIIRGDLTARQLIIPKLRLKNFIGHWNVDLSYQKASTIQLKAAELTAYHRRFSTLQINAHGYPHAHRVNASVLANNPMIGKTQLKLLLTGNIKHSLWQGLLDQFTITSQRLGNWHLKNRAKLTLSSKEASLSPTCLSEKKGHLCLKGNWKKTDLWAMQLSGNRLMLGPLVQFMAPHLLIHSPVALNVHLTGKSKHLNQALFKIQFGKGYFLTPKKLGSVTTRFIHGSFIGKTNTHGLNANFQLDLSKKNKISGNIKLPNYILFSKLNRSQTFEGKLVANTNNLSIINALMPDRIKLKGRVAADLNLRGTLTHPRLNGNLTLTHGSATITPLNITLNKITTHILATGTHITYRINAYSKNRLIKINGQTQLDAPNYSTEFTADGNNALILNTMEYKIYATGRLKIKIKKPKIFIRGMITIPKASLKPAKINGVVTLPEEVVFIGPVPKTISPWKVFLKITIKAGKKVMLNGLGAKGRLTGKISVSRTPMQSMIANGRIGIVNGTYTTRGQTLKILSNSYISYLQSPLNNPNLNITASRTITPLPTTGKQIHLINPITVGLNIRGTLRYSNIELYSDPANLSQADILSYLIFGHPANANTPGNISFLLQAINILNLGGGKFTPGGISDHISQGLGLSELGVETQTSTVDALGTPLEATGSSFVIGRYLSPKVYVRYSRGLSSHAINIVQVRYLFSKHWAIQTESSSLGNGVDLLYTIETN